MPVDTDKHVSFVLLSSPSYSGIMDLMAGAQAPACMQSRGRCMQGPTPVKPTGSVVSPFCGAD